jgi:hypothetical protein
MVFRPRAVSDDEGEGSGPRDPMVHLKRAETPHELFSKGLGVFRPWGRFWANRPGRVSFCRTFAGSLVAEEG